MTNVIPFPGTAFHASGANAIRAVGGYTARVYEFTPEELDHLCRWYSAMKYAFPRLEGLMTVCHKRRYSAIGLYSGGHGATLSCLLSKHEIGADASFFWSTDQDLPRRVRSLAEVTQAQIGAIAPPRNETRWLDLIGWMEIVRRAMAGSRLYAV